MGRKPIDLDKDTIVMPVHQIPQYRTMAAMDRGNLRNLLFTTFAGIGDHVCAEPTLRYAAKMRNEYDKIALATSIPDIYAHIKFDRIFQESYNRDEWLVFKTIPDEKVGLAPEFISHGLTNCVDASSLFALRLQLPTKDREIQISSRHPGEKIAKLINGPSILIHAGKHWPSKTFPKWWWDKVIETIYMNGIMPILIGANVDGNRSTVDVDASKCHDLRSKTMLTELAWLCQRTKVLLTNDSAPLHFAASTDPADYAGTGNAHILYLATCKHPDFITHFRKGAWQWQEENWSKGGVWDHLGFLPNKKEDVHIDTVDPEMLESWLPDPREYGEAAVKRCYAG